MSARIESVATAWSRGGPFARGALRLSDEAARACLDRAHRRPWEVELLINAGVYREKNVAEPAIASIIQEDIGANPGHPPVPRHHGTFSFDLLNGGCGFVSAAQIVDGFVASGGARLGMIVAGDAHPSPRTSDPFPFAPAGGAVLLAHDGGGGEGFSRFEVRTFAEDAALFEAHLRFDPERHGVIDRRGRNVLDVSESPRFGDRCVAHASEVTGAFLAGAGLRAADVDLLVTSQYPPRFGDDVARALGVAPERLARVRPELAATHTAGPIAALEAAIASGAFARARHVVFVTAGAGITIGVALYTRRAAS